MSELMTGSCPNCGSKLSYGANDTTVTCFACDNVVRVADISASAGRSFAAAAPTSFAAFTGLITPNPA